MNEKRKLKGHEKFHSISLQGLAVIISFHQLVHDHSTSSTTAMSLNVFSNLLMLVILVWVVPDQLAHMKRMGEGEGEKGLHDPSHRLHRLYGFYGDVGVSYGVGWVTAVVTAPLGKSPLFFLYYHQ